MILELVVAMLACARIGAIHSIVFGGYRFRLKLQQNFNVYLTLLIF